jgi:hypothetical protein
MSKSNFSFGSYFPIFHKVKNIDNSVIYFATQNRDWKYKVSVEKPLIIEYILDDLFSFLNTELIKYKIEVGDFTISESDKFNFYNSIISLLAIVSEIYIYNIDKTHLFFQDLHSLLKKVLINPVERKKYIKAISNWDTTFNVSEFINNELPNNQKHIGEYENECGNPYSLNQGYNDFNQMGDKFREFASYTAKLLNGNTGQFDNIKDFFSGSCYFKGLEFKITTSCIRRYFEKIHDNFLLPSSIITANDGRIPNTFICSSCYKVVLRKKTTIKSPINHKTFAGANIKKCTTLLYTQLIQSASNAIKV